MWKGRVKMSNGYMRVRRPEHHRAASDGYVMEHILNYENEYGIPVQKGWHIHHRNGIRDDNRPQNLELWRKSHPYGQRAEDIIMNLIETLGKAKLLDEIEGLSKQVYRKELAKAGV